MRKNDIFAHDHGEVSEWSNEQSWKDCSRGNRLEGSNPSLSAKQKTHNTGELHHWYFFYKTFIKKPNYYYQSSFDLY